MSSIINSNRKKNRFLVAVTSMLLFTSMVLVVVSLANAEVATITANQIVAKQGAVITINGSGFSNTPGSTVALALMSTAGGANFELSGTSVKEDGSFTASVTIPTGVPVGVYMLSATDFNGLTATTPFGIAYPNVVAPANAVTGQTITVTGNSFGVLGSSTIGLGVPITASISIGGVLVADNLNTATLAAGVNVVVPSVPMGSQVVKIASNLPGLDAETSVTITRSSTVTAEPSITQRDSNVNVAGNYFTPNRAGTILILNATNRQVVDIFSSFSMNETGSFSIPYSIGSNWSPGTYIVNATDANGLTVETTFIVIKVAITIATDSNTYQQGDIGAIQLACNTATTVQISIYDSNNALFTQLDLKKANWIASGSGSYVYQEPVLGGSSTPGALFQIPSNAPTGIWRWNATINDGNEPQKYNGTFTVNVYTATPNATQTASPPSLPTATPTSTVTGDGPDDNSNVWPTVIIIIIVVALIIAVVMIVVFVLPRYDINILYKNQ